jgi:hypothetical protein
MRRPAGESGPSQREEGYKEDAAERLHLLDLAVHIGRSAGEAV